MPADPETPRPNLPVRRTRPVTGPVEDREPRSRPEPDEEPSPEDLERFGGVTVKCPMCGTELYDNVAICWNCGHVMGDGTSGRSLPAWAVAALVVVVVVMVLTMVR